MTSCKVTCKKRYTWHNCSYGYKDPRHLDYVCKLRKELYGLKQIPQGWHETIAHYLVTMGFCMADAHHSLYVQKND